MQCVICSKNWFNLTKVVKNGDSVQVENGKADKQET